MTTLAVHNLINGQTASTYTSAEMELAIKRAWVYMSALRSDISYTGTIGESDMVVSADNVASVLVDFAVAILREGVTHKKYHTDQVPPRGLSELFTDEMRRMLTDGQIITSDIKFFHNSHSGDWND